jgi:hypothetical protein
VSVPVVSESIAATRHHAAATHAGIARSLHHLMTSGLAWGLATAVALVVWILLILGGQEYYASPLATRGYAPAHRLLRPSGPAGQMFGVVGTLLMLMPFIYMIRKRVGRGRAPGTLRVWLEIHLFCGIVGPVLVTFHTSFKFNGIISAAYWSMVLVVLSGFVGRYLYVRIPRSIRGHELTQAELDARAEDLRAELAQSVASPAVLNRIAAFERSVVPDVATLSFRDLFFGEVRLGRAVRRFNAELGRAGMAASQRADIVRLAVERSTLLRRTAYLRRTKQLFDLWHVFHLPLVYLLLVIAAMHIGVALYLGYVPFRW